MKPPGAALGSVDGGWWPWSDDLAAELPALVAVLGARVGPVNRVAYHLDTWTTVARKAPVDGRMIRFEGFLSIGPHTVVVIGSDHRRVSLLVVPPDTPEGAARAALRSAADHDSTASVADFLAGNGVLLDAHHFSPVLIPGARQAGGRTLGNRRRPHLVTRKQPAEDRTPFRVTICGTSAADFAQQTRTLSPS